ncbi:MAG: hypothetical protein RL129_94 [Actinomycetota bacterium]|jgi:predicted dehydrogenase
MRVLIVGLGQRGKVHKNFLGEEVVATVDKLNSSATYRDLKNVPLESFDAAVVATDEDSKYDVVKYLISNSKHVLVEKPFFLSSSQAKTILDAAEENNCLIKVAYNHDFEYPVTEVFETISKTGSNIYSVQIEYRNGTAENIRNNPWRDSKFAVIHDLLPHVLSLIYKYFSEEVTWTACLASNKENQGSDNCFILGKIGEIDLFIFISYLSWQNSFKLEINSADATYKIDGLGKWLGSRMEIHNRQSPPSIPTIYSQEFPKIDNSILDMWNCFKEEVKLGFNPSAFSKEAWILKNVSAVEKLILSKSSSNS